MIKIEDVSPSVKKTVVRLFDRDAFAGIFSEKTLRVVVTGLAAQTLNFGDRNGSNLTDEEAVQLYNERQNNFSAYASLARDIYADATLADIGSTFGQDVAVFISKAFNLKPITAPASTPDATGNDLPSGECDICGGPIHD